MKSRTMKFTLDCSKVGNQLCIDGIRQGDANSIVFIISLANGINLLDVVAGKEESVVVTMYGKKPDGTTIVRDCGINEDGNITYTIHTQDTTCVGIVSYQLVVTSTREKILASPVFSTMVEERNLFKTYTVLTAQPDDWADGYDKYYYYENGRFYKLNRFESESAPEWVINKYYSVNDNEVESTSDFDALAYALLRAKQYSDRTEEYLAEVKRKADKSTTLAGYGITDALQNAKGTVSTNNLADNCVSSNKLSADVRANLNSKAESAKVNQQLSLKADVSSVYTKSESDALLKVKANSADVDASVKTINTTIANNQKSVNASLESLNTALANKADTDVVNKVKQRAESNTTAIGLKVSRTDFSNTVSNLTNSINGKADSNSVYSKAETDNSLGKKADKADVANQFSELKDDLDEIDDLFLKKELIVNLSSFKDESTGEYKNAGRYYYIPANNVVGITPDNNYACIPIELKAGTYSVRNINPYYSFYISNRQAVRFGSAESSFISTTFELPIDTTLYVTVRVVPSSNGHKTVAIASGDTIPDDISTLGIFSFDTAIKLDSVAKLEEKIPSVLTVKKDGTGDFSTLKEAIDYSRSHSNLTIEVYEGTYDLIEEFGSDYFENLGSASSNEGLHLGNNVHIIFSSNSKVICNYEGDNANVHKYFSPFTCSANGNHKGFTLENLDLECSNVRYAIHDEVLSQKGRYVNKYKNCRVYIDNTSNSNWDNRQCIGGGLGGNGYIEIDGCYFESVPTTSKPNGGGIVSYHCGKGTEGDNYCSKVTIKNSYFANEDTVRCSYYGNQTTMSTVTVNNCSLGWLPYCGLESTQYTTVNMKLIEFNNTVRAN